MRGRNGLKSKVSTLEELYDFFSENTQKLHQHDVIFGAVDILSTGSYIVIVPSNTNFAGPVIYTLFSFLSHLI